MSEVKDDEGNRFVFSDEFSAAIAKTDNYTEYLIKNTADTYLQYSKKALNPVYLHSRNADKIKKAIIEIMK